MNTNDILDRIKKNFLARDTSPDIVDTILKGFSGAETHRHEYRQMYDDKHRPPPPPPVDGLPSDIAVAMTQEYKDLGLTATDIDTIQSLVACPENGSSRWPLFLNYIEYGDDADIRGYTATIFGACSGTGDLYEVFKNLQSKNPHHKLCKYTEILKNKKGGDISGIEGLAHVGGDPTKAKADWSKWTPNGRTHLDHIDGDLARLSPDDTDWAWAVWKTFDDMYWKSAWDFCQKHGKCQTRPGPKITTKTGFGFIVDMALNHGPAWYWDSSRTWKRVFNEMTNPRDENETAWLLDLIEARRTVLKSGFQGLDWSKSGDRCSIWKELVERGNVTLSRPIRIAASTKKIWPDGLVLS